MGVRFEVRVNGRVVCVAGIRGDGELSVSLNRVQRSAARYPKNYHRRPHGRSLAAWSQEAISMGVAGIRCSQQGSEHDRHVGWHQQDLRPGDEVIVRILPPGRSDRPKRRRAREAR
jgi:hypothetical protein